ncbi:MAG: hypothetical protein NT076_01150, partial [Candidatus Pacearchaeota archaeon]|nr:hypothetical protein [Candidatus Pacearchaeota archaeon]
DSLITHWTKEYYKYALENDIEGDWVFIYGDAEKITVLGLTNSSAGGISLIIGGGETRIPIEGVDTQKYSFRPEGNNVSIEFNKIRYSMTIKEGENFFFVIREGKYATQEE